MTDATITFANASTRQLLDRWSGGKGFDAAEQIRLHLEQRFQVHTAEVITAIDHGEFMIVQVTTNQWREAREFGLLSNGALAW